MYDLDKYIGLPYSARTLDCADLTLLIQNEVFGREVTFAGKRKRPLDPEGQAEVLQLYCGELGIKTETPEDGDAILMREAGSTLLGHVGTYFFLAYTPYVLHTSESIGGSRLHKLSELPSLGISIGGYYKWKLRQSTV